MSNSKKQKAVLKTKKHASEEKAESSRFAPHRMVEYLGSVNYATTERVLGKIKDLLEEAPEEEITMLVTSPGGPTGTAMSFYDTIHSVLRPKLTTVGSGDVDSAGIVLFLAGEKRYVTKNTTLLFHLAGRTFEGGVRFTASEIERMIREDKLKDYQYASLVADRSHGLLNYEQVLTMMERNTILTPVELVSFGLADAVLE
jgi:ATP-dependent protease ClpP protease subunit